MSLASHLSSDTLTLDVAIMGLWSKGGPSAPTFDTMRGAADRLRAIVLDPAQSERDRTFARLGLEKDDPFVPPL